MKSDILRNNNNSTVVIIAVVVKIWDEEAAKQKSDGICKGLFMASYRTNHFFRRCDALAKEGGYCDLCARVRAGAEGHEDVTLSEFQEYEVVRQSVQSRAGIASCHEFWDTEAKRQRKENVNADYPYF